MSHLLPGIMLASVWFAAVPAGARDRQPPPGGILPPTLQRHRVAVVRRPGCRDYEKAVEEFRGRVRASVRLLPARPEGKAELTRMLERLRPHLVLAVGQTAHDRLHALPCPLVETLVFHADGDRPRVYPIPGRVPASRVLATLRLIRPDLRHLAVLHGPRSAGAFGRVVQPAETLGFTLHPISAPTPGRAIALLRRMNRRAKALWLLTDLDILTPQVLQYALGVQFRRRVLLVGATRRHAEQGALMAVDQEPHSIGRHAADLANRILAGAAPAGTEDPAPAVRLCVNASTAKTINVPLGRLKAAGAELVQ